MPGRRIARAELLLSTTCASGNNTTAEMTVSGSAWLRVTTAQTNTAAATNTVSFGAPNLYGALTGNADTATTATTANAGDSATAFFSSGQIERARGGTGADTSAYGDGLLGSDSGNNTIDVDTLAELETALGGVDITSSTELLVKVSTNDSRSLVLTSATNNLGTDVAATTFYGALSGITNN